MPRHDTITITDNRWAEIEDEGAEDIRRLLRYHPDGFQFAGAYQKGYWDGFKYLTSISGTKLRIPIGLLEYIQDQPFGQRYKLVDQRVKPQSGHIYSDKQLVDLDPHQESAVQAALEGVRALIKYPTGTGKGRVIGETARRVQVPWLILCDKKDLLAQLLLEVHEATGVKVGAVGAGRHSWQNVTVATVQSLAPKLKADSELGLTERAEKRELLKILAKFQGVGVDEAHHVTSDQFQTVLKNLPGAYWRHGYSATPFKSYRVGKKADLGAFLSVMAYLGPPVAEMTLTEGIDTGRIVSANVYMIKGCDYSMPKFHPDRPLTIDNYPNRFRIGIIENTKRNAVIKTLCFKLSHEQTVVLTSRVEHAEALGHSMACPVVTGKTSTAERDKHYTAFRDGRLNLLVIGKLGDEALNIPNIDNLILAGGGKADHVQMQRVGRALRSSTNKAEASIFDFMDEGTHIGTHAKHRRKLYSREEAFTVVDVTVDEIVTM